MPGLSAGATLGATTPLLSKICRESANRNPLLVNGRRADPAVSYRLVDRARARDGGADTLELGLPTRGRENDHFATGFDAASKLVQPAISPKMVVVDMVVVDMVEARLSAENLARRVRIVQEAR